MNAPNERASPSRLFGLYLLAAATACILPASGPAAEKVVVNTLAEGQRTYEALLPAEETRLGNAGVVVYLHESDFKGFDRVKADYWPIFRDRNCLLILPRSRNPVLWASGEDKYLNDVLADVRTRYPIDPKKVVLMGVSGGAQMALFLLDRQPKDFRAAVLISGSPVAVRGSEIEWFYPSRETLKACPYFVANHITQGASLMYWRQVRCKMAPLGASLSILPVLGEVSHYLPPPKDLPAWLDAVLAGKHPDPLPDPQKEAVAKMFAPFLEALPKALESAQPVKAGETLSKEGATYALAVPLPEGFVRGKGEDEKDASGGSLTQIRLEHPDLPLYVRCEAHVTAKTMADALADQEAQTERRGMLYQVYHAGKAAGGDRPWTLKVGSITYPDQTRGWVSTLFLHAIRAVSADGRAWEAVMVMDETMEPDATKLVGLLKTVLAGQQAKAKAATPAPGGGRKNR